MRSALLVAALAASCSTARETTQPKAPIVKQEDLPARERAIVEAWKKGGAAWDLERESVRADPQLARFVVDNVMIQMVQAFDRSRLARVGQEQAPFERAQNELVILADHSTPVLVQFLTVKDDVVATLAADTLVRIARPPNEPTLELLAHPDWKIRRRAAELLGKLPHAGGGEPRVLELLAARVTGDQEWIVRAQSAQSLGERGSRHDHKGFALGALGRALADADETVAAAAAKGLGELGEGRAIPKLCDGLAAASAKGQPVVVDAIQDALAKLSRDATRRDVNQWRAWWREHEGDFVPAAPPRSGQ